MLQAYEIEHCPSNRAQRHGICSQPHQDTCTKDPVEKKRKG
jgi:hypothetical protein